MTADNAYVSAEEIRDRIVRREVSATEVMAETLSRMEALEPVLNAFVTPTPEQAMEAAREADRLLAGGGEPGALHGVPISVKDLINVGGVRTTFGSLTMANNVARDDAPSVERAHAAGACVIGKTTTTEFGCKAGGGDSPLSGITRNAWDTSKTTGGSSAGAATSVAAGVTPFALGTDGGGSIRIPSSLCGVFGIKAQYGRVPVFPTSATPTLSHVGPIARTVRDAALLLGVISGFDARDPASVSEPVPDYLAACEAPVEGMRVAWSPTLGYAKPVPEVLEITERAARTLESVGCSVELVEEVMDDPVDLWNAEFYAGAGTRLKDALRDSRELLDPAVAEVLDGALKGTVAEYYAKVFARYELREKVRRFFEPYDLLVTPTLPVPAFEAGVNVPPELPERNVVSWVYYTYPFNLTGNPAASIPCGFTEDGLPVGLQLMAGTNREIDLLRVSAAFEAAKPWSHLVPNLPGGL
ncbi:MAG: amidase family protein [Actinomycetota bacterium]|nr:amidase family protein [Actinomycetota bacterium]